MKSQNHIYLASRPNHFLRGIYFFLNASLKITLYERDPGRLKAHSNTASWDSFSCNVILWRVREAFRKNLLLTGPKVSIGLVAGRWRSWRKGVPAVRAETPSEHLFLHRLETWTSNRSYNIINWKSYRCGYRSRAYLSFCSPRPTAAIALWASFPINNSCGCPGL